MCPRRRGHHRSASSRSANVVGPAMQGITAGQFDELVRAIRAGDICQRPQLALPRRRDPGSSATTLTDGERTTAGEPLDVPALVYSRAGTSSVRAAVLVSGSASRVAGTPSGTVSEDRP